MDDTLIVWRALHFAATIQVAGVLIFCGYVLRNRSPASLERLLRLIFWISLVLAFISGAAWFCAVAASIDDASWTAAITDGTAATVLTDTQFGRAWLVRIVAGLLLAASAAIAKKNSIRRSNIAGGASERLCRWPSLRGTRCKHTWSSRRRSSRR